MKWGTLSLRWKRTSVQMVARQRFLQYPSSISHSLAAVSLSSPYDKGEKSRHFQTTVDSSAIFAVFMVCMLPSIRLIPFLLPIV